MNRSHLTVALALAAGLCLFGCGGGGGGGPPQPEFDQVFLEVLPDVGTTAGGTEIMLKGRGFLDRVRQIRAVRFGVIPAATWEVLDDETIRVVSPPGARGETVINLVGDNAPSEDGILLTRGYTYRAPIVYVADGPAAVDPQLYAVDLDTGTPALVGVIGFAVESMAMNGAGELYAVEAGSPYRLLRISRATGAGTPVALVRDGGSGDPVVVRDLTFVGNRLLGRTEASRLVEIDLVFGTASEIGTIPVAVPGGGMATDDATRVLLADAALSGQLYELDVVSGLIEPGPVLDRALFFLDLATVGTSVYALDADLPGSGGPGLVRIDRETGAVEEVTPLPPSTTALARDV